MKNVALTVIVEVPEDELISSLSDLLDEMENLASSKSYSIYNTEMEVV